MVTRINCSVQMNNNFSLLVVSAYTAAMYSMARLNKTGAQLMHKYGKKY